MPGHYCPTCGAPRAAGPCSCQADATDTAVLPHIEGPPLVRPYVHASGEPGDATLPPPEPLTTVRPPAARAGGQGAPAADDLGMFPLESGAAPAHVAFSRAAGRQVATRRRSRRNLLVAVALAVPAAAGIGFALSGSGGGSHRLADPAPTPSALTDPTLLTAGPSAGEPASPRAGSSGTATTSAAPGAATSAPVAPSASASTAHAAVRSAGTTGPAAPAAPVTTAPAAGPTTTPPPTATSARPTASSTGPRTLSLGMSGPDVVELQQRLSRAWTYHGRPSGTYDQKTADAVAEFQKWYHVQGDPSGVYGPNTRARLEQAYP